MKMASAASQPGARASGAGVHEVAGAHEVVGCLLRCRSIGSAHPLAFIAMLIASRAQCISSVYLGARR